MRVAYFVNRYPAVSHTFIRREIRALEALGVSVVRFALRPGADLADDDDKAEVKRTRFILETAVSTILGCFARTAVTQPYSLASTIGLAISLGWKSETGILRHLVYAIEATVLASWCRQERVEHVHAHFGTNPAAVVMLMQRLFGIPYSFTAHGPDEFEKAPLLAVEEKLKHAKFVVCASSFGRSQYMRWSAPELWHKIVVVHCGLDRAFFERTITPPPSNLRLVCVGRFDERKAQVLLVAAARRLHDEGIPCEIVLAGDGPMRPRIEAAIREAKLEKWVTITGWISGERVRTEILAARALILPSFSENLPVVLMEALALGRPVISTYVAGIPELVSPGKSGWLVPAGDDGGLAEAMREALTTPTERLSAMAEIGRRHVAEAHDAALEALKLRDLFGKYVSKPTGSCELSKPAANKLGLDPVRADTRLT